MSERERDNGTVIVKCKNANDRDKLQKRCVEKIGNDFKVQIPKVKKKFVKIVWIDIDEASLTNQEIIDNSIQQNNLNEYCDKIEMKIVKRIMNEGKNDLA